MPKIFGLEVKPWMLWTAGGAAVIVLLLYMRRGSGQAVPIPSPKPDSGGLGGGGGGGVAGPAYTEQPDVIPEELDEFTRQLQELTLEERRTELGRRQAMYELEQEQQGILANLFTQTASAEAEVEQEFLRGQLEAQKRVTAIAPKEEIRCPQGYHVSNVPGVGVTCIPKAGGGLSIGSFFKPILQAFGGGLTGAAGAAGQYYGSKALGVPIPQQVPRQPSQQPGTPPFAPAGRQVMSTGRVQAGTRSDPGAQLYDPYTRESVYG